jgi:RNA polymerase sigma factor (sigma-70 family)
MALMIGSPPAVAAGSEGSLIVAARDGDDRAFAELYARYRDRISAYIHRRVADHGRAEDVAQEVFISALRRIRNSDQAIVFKPWIYEIAKNACIDEHRRMVRSREVPLGDEADGPVAPRPLRSVAPTPPAVLESKLQLQDLRGAFGGLSENHHRLLVMREFEGLSYDEIGQRLGMSRQMVESALFRARRKLGVEYEELSSGRRCQQVQAAIEDGRIRAFPSLGIRERRQLARHLAHCQACRTQAQLAGVAEPLTARRGLAARIAGLLPFPLWGWRRSLSASRSAAPGAGGHAAAPVGLATAPTISAALTGAAAGVATLILAGGGASGALAEHDGPLARPAADHTAQASATSASGALSRRPPPVGSRPGRARHTSQAGGARPKGHGAVTRTAPPAAPAGPAASSGSAAAPTTRVPVAPPSPSDIVHTVTGSAQRTVSNVVNGAQRAVDKVANTTVPNTTHQIAQTVSHPSLPAPLPTVSLPSVPGTPGHSRGASPALLRTLG